MATRTTRYLWRSDGEPAGHMSYCAYPDHGLNYWCSAADEGQGDYSEAWEQDHAEIEPDPAWQEIGYAGRDAFTYARPAHRSIPDDGVGHAEDELGHHDPDCGCREQVARTMAGWMARRPPR